jgi:hypothetical protein
MEPTLRTFCPWSLSQPSHCPNCLYHCNFQSLPTDIASTYYDSYIVLLSELQLGRLSAVEKQAANS